MTLVFDTETTGRCDHKNPDEPDMQPRLLQFGAVILGDDGVERGCVNFLVKPFGFEIPAEATAIHGITKEMAGEFGVSLAGVLTLFERWVLRSRILVAYNCDFDRIVMANEFRRMGRDVPFAGDHVWVDPMKLAMDVCKLPGGFRGEYKWPRLAEASEIILGVKPDKSHDALADVRTTVALFRKLRPVELV